MKTSEIMIEELDRSSISEAINLLVKVFGRDKNYVQSKTNWAFNNNHSKVLVAIHNNNIIAVRGGMEWELRYNEEIFKGIQFHGTSVHPQYRRLGLFTRLNELYVDYAQNNNIDLIFNVSVEKSRRGYEKLGWSYINGFHRLTLFNNPIKCICNYKYLSGDSFEKNDDLLLDDKSIDTILNAKNKRKNLICANYDKESIKWRLSCEADKYQILKGEKYLIVYKVSFNGKIRKLIIGDVFLKENSYKNFKKAFNKLYQVVKPDITYTYIFENNPIYKYYLLSKFLPNPFNYNLNFGTRIFSNNDILKSENKWALTYLDIDTF